MAVSKIEIQELRKSASDGQLLAKYIRGEATERRTLVNRASEALTILKNDTKKDLKDPEKKAILLASTGVIEDAISELENKIKIGQGKIDVEDLQKEVEEYKKRKKEAQEFGTKEKIADASETQAKAKSFFDQAVDLAPAHLQPFLRQSNTFQTTVGIVGAVAGFLGIRWLWREIFGDDKNEGGLRKSIKWLASIGGAIAGMIGLRYFFSPSNPAGSDKPDEPNKDGGAFLPDKAQAPYNDARGVKDQLTETGGKAVDLVSRDLAILMKAFETGDFSEAMRLCDEQSWVLVQDHLSFVVKDLLGNTVAKPLISADRITQWATTGEKPDDFWIVWGKAGAAYFMGTKTLQVLRTGSIRGVLPLNAKDFLLSAVKMGSGPLAPLRDFASIGTTLLREGGYEALYIKYIKQSWIARFKHWEHTSAFFTPKTEKGVLDLLAELRTMNKEIDTMHQFNKGSGTLRIFSNSEVDDWKNVRNSLLRKVRGGASGLKIAEVSDPLVREVVTLSTLDDLELLNEKISVARTKLLGEKPAEVVRAVNKWKLPGIETDDALDLLRQAEEGSDGIKLGAKEMALIEQSPGAKKIIAGAVKTGNVTEVRRALKAAKVGAGLRVALNVFGAALDIFTIKMVIADYQENEAKIKETENPALAELYRSCRQSQVIEAGVPVTSLGILGYSVVFGGKGLLAGAASTGAIALIPITIAAGAGMYGKKRLDAESETWLKSEKDWVRSSTPDMLLKKLAEIQPGKQSELTAALRHGGGVFIEPGNQKRTQEDKGVRGFETVEASLQSAMKADEGTRETIMRAYIIKTSNLPRYDDETDQAYDRRSADFIADQMRYIAAVTQNKFDTTLTEVFDRAKLHAELTAESRQSGEKKDGQKNYSELPFSNPEKRELLSAYADEKIFEPVLLINNAAQTEGGETAIRQVLIEDMTGFVWKQGANIEAYGGEGSDESAMLKLAAERMLRRALDLQVRTFAGNKGRTSVAEYKKSLEKIRAIALTPIAALKQEARDFHLAEEISGQTPEARARILTPENLMQAGVQERARGRETTKQNSFTIEEILKRRELKVQSDTFEVSGAAGYTFAPVKYGAILYSEPGRRSAAVKIQTNDPFPLPFGEYAIYKPNEKIKESAYGKVMPGSLGIVNIGIELKNQDALVTRKKLMDLRFDEGKRALLASGAKKFDSAHVYGLNFSTLDRYVDFVFDENTLQWNVALGGYLDFEEGRMKTALAGRPAQDFEVKSMAWGNQEKYNEVIRKIGAINQLQLKPEEKK